MRPRALTVLAAAATLLLLCGPVAALALPAAVGTPAPAAPGARPGHAHGAPGPQAVLAADPAGLFTHPEDTVQARALPLGDPSLYSVDAAADYRVTFRCPAAVESEQGIESLQCPAYIADVEDVMAQPVLLVDRKNPEIVAFNALHGGPGSRLPTAAPAASERSRDNLVHQPHTTFQSKDGGAWFDDNRYYSRLPSEYAEIFGEDNDALLDHQGRLLLSSLYSYRVESGGPLQSAILAIKATQARGEPAEYDSNYARLDPREPGAFIHETHLAFDARTKQAVNLWLEQGADGRQFIDGKSADLEGGSMWEPIPDAVRLGPCSDMTNAVESSDAIYVGCVAAEGYPLPPDGAHGDLMVHRFDPATWNHTFAGVAPVPAQGGAVLASAEAWSRHGLAVAGAGLVDGRPSVKATLGAGGKDWFPTAEYGDRVTDLTRAGAVPEAVRVNALAYVPSSGTLHMLYMERYPAASAATSPDPAAPGAGSTPFHKVYAVAHATGSLLTVQRFGYGDPQSRATFSVRVQGTSDAVFDDQHDSIVVVPRGNMDRVFLAAGDHGLVRYAEVVEENPMGPAPPIFPATVPIPAPITAINPAVVGAVAGALSLSVVGRMAASRNKKTAEAPT